MLASLTSLLVCTTLALSPWPATPSAPEAAPPVTTAALMPTSLPASLSLLPSAPAPAPRSPLAQLPAPRGSATPHPTRSITTAPPPPAETLAYPRPYPVPPAYTKRHRSLLIAGTTLAFASVVPLVFAIRSSLLMYRARDEFIRTEPSDVDGRYALYREFVRQGEIMIATSVITVVVAATSLVLLRLARGKKKPDTQRPMPSARGV